MYKINESVILNLDRYTGAIKTQIKNVWHTKQAIVNLKKGGKLYEQEVLNLEYYVKELSKSLTELKQYLNDIETRGE